MSMDYVYGFSPRDIAKNRLKWCVTARKSGGFWAPTRWTKVPVFKSEYGSIYYEGLPSHYRWVSYDR